MTKKKKIVIPVHSLEEKLHQDNTYTLNMQFKSKTKKVALKEAKFSEVVKSNVNVEKERKATIQSVIVRLMKSRKELEYAKLVTEVEKLLLKFKPTSRVKWRNNV